MTANQFHLAGKASSFLRKYPELVGGSVVLVGLYLTSLYRYVLFHSLAEVFSIVVACGVFMVYWNSRRFLSNDYFLFVGIAYLCVGCLDLLHTLAYKGMGVFPTNDGNLAIQLWIVARYLESLSLLAACVFLHRRLNVQLVATGYAMVFALILGSILFLGIFPDCFIDGIGVTTFKTVSEVVICGILVASVVLLVRRKADFDQHVFRLLLGSLIVTIASELSFSYYTNPYGPANLLGHLFKLVSFYLLYKAFIEEGLKRPCDLIFRDLRRASFCVEQAGDSIFCVDSEGQIVFANQKASEVLEYSKEELQSMTVFDIDAMVTREWWGGHWEAIREKKSFVVESYHRTKTDRLYPVEVSVNYMKCDGKEYNYAFARDISERKEAEEQLAQFAAIVYSSQDAIYATTLDGVVTLWNLGAERLYGYTATEMLGKPISILLPPERCDEIATYLSKVRDGGNVEHYDAVRRRKNGSLVDVAVTLSPIKNRKGQIIGASGFAHDITNRKRIERELIDSKMAAEVAEHEVRKGHDILQSVIDGIGTPITLIDRNYQILLANHAVRELAGGIDPVVNGRRCHQVSHRQDTPCEGQNDPCPLKMALESRQPAKVVHRHYDFMGKESTVEVTATPIVDDNNEIRYVIESCYDITELKQVETELRNAKQAAEDANRSKSEFLANMSHELRTPMTAILGFADILLEDSVTEQSIESAQIIKRNGEHLLNLINDILDLSKIEAGKCTVDLQKCLPSNIAADVISLMKVRADAKGLPLTFEVQGDIPAIITTDPIRLRQSLINLIGNSIKFTEVGSIRVVMRLDANPNSEAKLAFDVIDTGIGMSEEQMGLLFRPFSQVDGSATRRFGGTGLGLAISKRMAELLGGDISVRSSPGQGSTFSLSIGIGKLDSAITSEPSKAVIARESVGNAQQKLDCRILLAEDGPDNQRLIAFLLRKAGAEVELAENGQIALDLALAAQQSGNPFDVILMDMQMPVLDGYQATQNLRSAGYKGPIIALTAHAMTEDRQKCIDAGCDDYITKPIDPKKFVGLIEPWVVREPSLLIIQ